MQIMVTGASGFTGGNLARRLASEGHQVRALCRPTSQTDNLTSHGIEIVEGELSSDEDVARAVKGAEKVYHIAAVFRTAGHPDSYYEDINVGGTERILKAARAEGCERVVHCSTIGVHGHVKRPPATETSPFAPGDIYQRTKLKGEMVAHRAIKDGQPVSIFRPGSIYGPGDMRFLKLFKTVQSGRFRMVGPGTTRLHLAYIDDLVDGIILCGTKPEALGDVFLLAGPDALTLKEIVTHIAEATGVEPPRGHVPLWPVYAAACVCEALCVPLRIDPPLHRRRVGFFTHHREFDISKAREILGYAPKISAHEGLRRTAEWYAAEGLIGPVSTGAAA